MKTTNNYPVQQDTDLEQRVRNYLAAQSRPALRTVQVQVHNGIVTLRGRVQSFYEKQLSVLSPPASLVCGVFKTNSSSRPQLLPPPPPR